MRLVVTAHNGDKTARRQRRRLAWHVHGAAWRQSDVATRKKKDEKKKDEKKKEGKKSAKKVEKKKKAREE